MSTNITDDHSEPTFSKSFRTTLFDALKSAGTIICDGYELDTQIDGERLGKPNLVMLSCDDIFTVIFHNQEIEIDESGTAMVVREGDTPLSPKTALTFFITVPIQEASLLKSEGAIK